MRALCAAIAGLALFTASAQADNIVFNGTVADTCDLSLMVPPTGTLALSSDHTILGSDQLGGLPVTVTIASVGTNTITVGAPTLTQSPPGYITTGQSIELGYVGAGLLSAINKPMGTGGGNFSAGILGLTGSTIVVNARVVNSNGFKLGDYQITSVVTCS